MVKSIIESWSPLLDDNQTLINKAIRSGLEARDEETRKRAKEAYESLKAKFPETAEKFCQVGILFMIYWLNYISVVRRYETKDDSDGTF